MSIDSARYARQSDSDFNVQFHRRWTEPPRPSRLTRDEFDAAHRARLHAEIEARLHLALRAEVAR